MTEECEHSRMRRVKTQHGVDTYQCEKCEQMFYVIPRPIVEYVISEPKLEKETERSFLFDFIYTTIMNYLEYKKSLAQEHVKILEEIRERRARKGD